MEEWGIFTESQDGKVLMGVRFSLGGNQVIAAAAELLNHCPSRCLNVSVCSGIFSTDTTEVQMYIQDVLK